MKRETLAAPLLLAKHKADAAGASDGVTPSLIFIQYARDASKCNDFMYVSIHIRLRPPDDSAPTDGSRVDCPSLKEGVTGKVFPALPGVKLASP
ncbi:MAG: hypothetical protein LBH65_04275 [Desulfovibrio sp.]|nr:hypothetical protein [Desulfovibrio sp.]